jgi:hypothetical protein
MAASIFAELHVEESLENPRPKKCVVDEVLYSNLKQLFNI